MRLRSVQLVLIAALAAASCASGALAGGFEHEKPPRPDVASHGTKDRAQRGSYCWTQSDGVHGVCAEYPYPLPTRRTVKVHPGSVVNVDLRTPATDLLIRRRNDKEYAPSCQADLTGEVWRFVVPADEDRTRGVILQGTYGGDDAIFGIRLKLHRHPVDSKALGDLNPCLPPSQ